jgi:hypothetical protein
MAFPLRQNPAPKIRMTPPRLGEADGQDSSIDTPEAEVPSLLRAVIEVLGYDALGIGERVLGLRGPRSSPVRSNARCYASLRSLFQSTYGPMSLNPAISMCLPRSSFREASK